MSNPVERADQRNENRLVGDEHPEQDQREDHIGAAEFPFREQIAVHCAEQRRDDRRRDDHAQARPEVRAQHIPGQRKATAIEVQRQVPHVREGHVGLVFEPVDDHDVDGHQIEQRRGDQQREDDVAAESAFLARRVRAAAPGRRS